MVVVSLGGRILRSLEGANVPFPNLITIRPDAKTGKTGLAAN
jgi:archaellum biogenesis ATPase FlaH